MVKNIMGLSAKRLGEKINLTAEQTNVLLKESGYHEGEPGDYIITDKGRPYMEEKSWDNGHGGYAARGYSYNEWDESIIDELDTSSENLQRIRDLTAQIRKERRNDTVNKQRIKNYNDDDFKEDYYVDQSSSSPSEDIGTAIGLAVGVGLLVARHCKMV